MVFTKRLREGIRRGRIRCSVRIWTRPHVKVGGCYAMDEGQIVEQGDPHQILHRPSHERTRTFLGQITLDLEGELDGEVSGEA